MARQVDAHGLVRAARIHLRLVHRCPAQSTEERDIVELDVPGRKLTLKVSDEELAKRRAAWKPKAKKYARGYGKIFSQHVSQADKGCDFDFLEGTAPIPEPEIH